MKKLFALVLACLMVFALGACGETSDNTTEPTTTVAATGSNEINWQTLPDDEIVGAWKPVDDVAGEYILFTPESKLRVMYGTVVFDASISFGADGNGIKSAYTDGSYLYGQWSYKIDGTVLTVSYPVMENGEITSFEEKVFNRYDDYEPITLVAKEDFKADDALVGKWTNLAYGDSYEFTADGYAIFSQNVDDGVYSYKTEIKHAYTVDGDSVTLYYYTANDDKEVVDTFSYSIDGTKLMIEESDYYLNGEGDPGVTEPAE